VSVEFSLATFNLHGGIDAWGRPFDALAAVTSLDADITFLQECWTNDGEPSFASLAAKELSASSREVTMATGRRARPHKDPPERWQRWQSFLDGDHGLFLESERPLPKSLTDSPRYADAEPGSFSLAVLSRFPILETHLVSLTRLRRDRAQRAILAVTLDLDGRQLVAIGTHMTHLSYGSPFHFRRLRHELRSIRAAKTPVVLGGDMNLWGPAVTLQLPSLRRAIKAKSWPSWAPHSQLDHLLVSEELIVLGEPLVAKLGSDHLALRARCELGEAASKDEDARRREH
jgi:endonuclease/exonuclease/phosphatase family metal-dependent hydrolase